MAGGRHSTAVSAVTAVTVDSWAQRRRLTRRLADEAAPLVNVMDNHLWDPKFCSYYYYYYHYYYYDYYYYY